MVESDKIWISTGRLVRACQHIKSNLIDKARSFYSPTVFHVAMPRELYVIVTQKYLV
jgi:hypothetical protein